MIVCEFFLNDFVVIFIVFMILFIEMLYIIIFNLDNVDIKIKVIFIRNIYWYFIMDVILLLIYMWYFFYYIILGIKECKFVYKWRKEIFLSFM